MNEAEAVELVKRHAERWSVPWVRVLKIEKRRRWNFRIARYVITFDTGEGHALAVLDARTKVVGCFECRPATDKGLLLPLWAVFPHYDSVTIGWRMGEGEDYKHRWHHWYRGLSEAERQEYKRKYPPPKDPELAWTNFYELIADKPADGTHPIAEFILGRVP
jgi:hypothetical protein